MNVHHELGPGRCLCPWNFVGTGGVRREVCECVWGRRMSVHVGRVSVEIDNHNLLIVLGGWGQQSHDLCAFESHVN